MSTAANRWSKLTEAVYRLTRSETGSEKRADQACALLANWSCPGEEVALDIGPDHKTRASDRMDAPIRYCISIVELHETLHGVDAINIEGATQKGNTTHGTVN